MNGRKTIGIIPARGGSKGLPGKNIKLLCGKPLIAYSIEQALTAGCFERVVVSTDCPDIAAVAEEFGAEVPFLRPAEFARDAADLDDAIAHLVNTLDERESYRPDAMAVLFPTYPFRTLELIRDVVRAVCEEAMWAHCEFRSDADLSRIVAFGKSQAWPMEPAFGNNLVASCAQSKRRLMWLMGTISAHVILPPHIRPLGVDHPVRRAFVRDKIAAGDRRFALPRKAVRVDDPILRIDIDGEADFLLAEKIIERGLCKRELETM